MLSVCKLSASFARNLKPLRGSLEAFSAFSNNTVCYNSNISMLYYTPNESFAKISKKKQEKMEYLKEREGADVPKTIDLGVYETSFKKCIDHYKAEIQKLKAGRLMPSTLEEVKISAYGEKVALSTLAQVAAKNATTVQLNVFDESTIPNIMKTLEHSELNLQVKRNDKAIVCTLLGGNTKEMKESVVKSLKNVLDQLKTKIKQEKTRATDEVKQHKKFMSEDVIRNAETEINDMSAKSVDEAEKLYKAKEKEIMSS